MNHLAKTLLLFAFFSTSAINAAPTAEDDLITNFSRSVAEISKEAAENFNSSYISNTIRENLCGYDAWNSEQKKNHGLYIYLENSCEHLRHSSGMNIQYDRDFIRLLKKDITDNAIHLVFAGFYKEIKVEDLKIPDEFHDNITAYRKFRTNKHLKHTKNLFFDIINKESKSQLEKHFNKFKVTKVEKKSSAGVVISTHYELNGKQYSWVNKKLYKKYTQIVSKLDDVSVDTSEKLIALAYLELMTSKYMINLDDMVSRYKDDADEIKQTLCTELGGNTYRDSKCYNVTDGNEQVITDYRGAIEDTLKDRLLNHIAASKSYKNITDTINDGKRLYQLFLTYYDSLKRKKSDYEDKYDYILGLKENEYYKTEGNGFRLLSMYARLLEADSDEIKSTLEYYANDLVNRENRFYERTWSFGTLLGYSVNTADRGQPDYAEVPSSSIFFPMGIITTRGKAGGIYGCCNMMFHIMDLGLYLNTEDTEQEVDWRDTLFPGISLFWRPSRRVPYVFGIDVSHVAGAKENNIEDNIRYSLFISMELPLWSLK